MIHFILVLFILSFFLFFFFFSPINKLALSQLSTGFLHLLVSNAEGIFLKFLLNKMGTYATVTEWRWSLRERAIWGILFSKSKIWPSWYCTTGTAAILWLLIRKWAQELIYLIILVQSKDTCNNLHNFSLFFFCRQFRTMYNAFNWSFISILKMKSSKNRLWSNINSCTISSV